MDDLKSEKFELEKEVANLKRSYLEISDSIAEIEKKLFTLNGHQNNSKENVQQAVLNNLPTYTSTPTKSKPGPVHGVT